jgi:hypothetical protein
MPPEGVYNQSIVLNPGSKRWSRRKQAAVIVGPEHGCFFPPTHLIVTRGLTSLYVEIAFVCGKREHCAAKLRPLSTSSHHERSTSLGVADLLFGDSPRSWLLREILQSLIFFFFFFPISGPQRRYVYIGTGPLNPRYRATPCM